MKQYIIFFLFFLTLSCLNDTSQEDSFVSLAIECSAVDPETKSSFTESESTIVDWNVYAYDMNGKLAAYMYSGYGSIISLKKNSSYHVYALANMGVVAAPQSESELKNYVYHAPAVSVWNTSGLPMSYYSKSYVKFDSNTSSINIVFERLVSKYCLYVDKTQLINSDFLIKSIVVKNSAQSITPFQYYSTSFDYVDHDFSSNSDIECINGGYQISFYMLENCRGTLLPDNRDPWQKTPSNIGNNANYCSYIEMTGQWMTNGAFSDAVCRMYLGRDSYSDFNIDRNTVSQIVLHLSDQGLLNSSWNVSRNNISDNRSLFFSPSQICLKRGADYQEVDIIESPAGQNYELRADQSQLDNAGITYYQSGNKILIKSNYCGSETPQANLYLYTWDGKLMGSLTATVEKAVQNEIVGFQDSYIAQVGVNINPVLQFSPDFPDLSQLQLTSSNSSVASWLIDPSSQSNPLIIVPKASGFSDLKIVWGNFTQTVHIYVPYDYSFVVPDPYFIMDLGQTVTCQIGTDPQNCMTGDFVATVYDSYYGKIQNVKTTYTEHFTHEGVDYGRIASGGSVDIVGVREGYCDITCSCSNSDVTAKFRVFIMTAGNRLRAFYKPTDGRTPKSLFSVGPEIQIWTENDTPINIEFAADANVTKVELLYYEPVYDYPFKKESDFYSAVLDGVRYKTGDVLTNMILLNSGKDWTLTGFDCELHFRVTFGNNSKQVPVCVRMCDEEED